MKLEAYGFLLEFTSDSCPVATGWTHLYSSNVFQL
jgi:hypothetical protein